MGAPVRIRHLGSAQETGTSVSSIVIEVVNVPGGPQTGNLIAVSLAFSSAASPGVVSASDFKGNTYRHMKLQQRSGGTKDVSASILCAFDAKALESGQQITISFSTPVAGPVVATAIEYSGTRHALPDDQTAGAGGASTTPASGSATTTFADEILLAAVAVSKASGVGLPSFTPGTGYTAELASSALNASAETVIYPEYRVVNATGSYNGDGTLSTSADWAAALVTLKAAPPATKFIGVGKLTLRVKGKVSFKGVAVLKPKVSVKNKMIGVAKMTLSGKVIAKGKLKLYGVASLVIGRFYNLFKDLGLIVGPFDNYSNFAKNNFGADRNRMLKDHSQRNVIEGIHASYERLDDDVISWREELASYADKRLVDVDCVLRQLGLTSPDIDDIFEALALRMQEDGKSIERSTVTIGTINADRNNLGNGTLFLTKVLDGVTEPSRGFPAHSYYDGLNSELAVPYDTQNLVCVSENEADGVDEGSEAFAWFGTPETNQLHYVEGTGDGPTVTVCGNTGLISNGNFEDWESNVPVDWTIDKGAAGTNVFQQTTDFDGDGVADAEGQARVYRGTSSLRIVGTGIDIQLSQDRADVYTPRKRHLVSVRVRSMAFTAGGTLTLQYEGDGYTASSSEKIEILSQNMPSEWTLYSFWINMPRELPDNWKFVIKPSLWPLANQFWLDSLLMSEVPYHNGIGAVIVPGNKKFFRDDKFGFDVRNDGKKFQEFFRRRYRTQVISSATATFLDSTYIFGPQ